MDQTTTNDGATTSGRRRGPWWLLMLVLVALTGIWVWFEVSGAPADQGGVVRLPWNTDHAQAVAEAKANGRPILVNFTGSDWCGWCVRLREQVFDTGIFASWAKDRVVLLECDFPRSRSLPAEIVRQNEELADRYQIGGFPTILVLDDQGRVLATSGYQRGGAAKWITDLEEALRRGSVESRRLESGIH